MKGVNSMQIEMAQLRNMDCVSSEIFSMNISLGASRIASAFSELGNNALCSLLVFP